MVGSQGSSQPKHRILLGLAVLALHLFVLANALTNSWEGTFGWFHVPIMVPSYADLRTMTAAVDAVGLGLDPLVSNPTDPWGRPMNYPRLWLALGWLMKSGQGVVVAGTIIALLFSVTCAILIAGQNSTRSSLAIAAVALSGASWLGLERANCDLVVFALVALASVNVLRPASLVIAISCALKIFPVPALLFAYLRERSRIAAVAVLFVAVYFAATYQDIVLMRKSMEASALISFGLKSTLLLAEYPGVSIAPVHIYLAFAAISGLAIGLGLALPLQDRIDPQLAFQFTIGAGIFLFSFVVASNWDYRLIFSILVIPFVLRRGLDNIQLSLGWVTVLAIFLSSNYLYLSDCWREAGVVVNVLAKALLFALVLFEFVRLLGWAVRQDPFSRGPGLA